MSLAELFDPGGIAVVGASSTPGKIGYEAMQNALEFDGPVHPVNPSSSGSLFGREFRSSVTEVDDVDLALLCVPGPVVPDVIEECGRADVGGAVVYAGGFAEAGDEGRRLQDRLVDAADAGDVRVLGPNTSGFVIPAAKLYASFASGVEEIPPGNVAVIAQSGGVAHALAFQAERAGRGLSAMVGLGNRATVGFTEAIRYFDGDDRTDAIVLHVEGSDDARGVLETCRAVSTPVVAYNVGRTDVGEFAESHTGAMTGEYALYEAGFRQYGVPTVDSTTALLDAGQALASSPRPNGPNVGVVTAQAGPGIIVTDRLNRAGASLPSLAEESRERLSELLPGITYAENPVDTGRPMPEFGDVVTTVARDPNVDVVLVYELYEDGLGLPIDALDGLASDVDKPVLFATDAPSGVIDDVRSRLREIGVPAFTTPERAADAVGALIDFAAIDTDRRIAGDAR